MAAARKKSVASSSGLPQLQIDNPIASNTILNKQAAASKSLYQQCILLKSRLLKIHDFPPYLDLVDAPDKDVVHLLWDCMALATPLCFLFNLLELPASDRINVSTDPDDIDLSPDNVKDRKKAAAFFIMGVQRLKKSGQWNHDVEFTVTDLINADTKDTNIFVKILETVTPLLDQLPQHVWRTDDQSPSHASGFDNDQFPRPGEDSPVTAKPANAQEAERNNIIRELLETERKYVQDLEVMQNYSRALLQQDIVDQDTIHHLFPGLNKLLDFQRKFLIELEQQMEHPWEQQRWGRCFSSNEQNFEVYEPYCANYTNASELVLVEEPHLMALSHMINAKSELPAFLIKPVQRICKYPLLLESLVKRCPNTHEFYAELVEGAASSKRVTDRVNEAQRRAENQATVKLLETRVEDWKGHALSNFGDLLLDDVFTVTKSDVDREYHVFLFEKIILCCKDATAVTNKKVGKSNSILKKTPSATPAPSLLAGGAAAAKRKATPLLLKGRIFLNNVTNATPANKLGIYALQVWWRGDDDLEYFTLRCRTEEQMKQWESAILRLIKEAQLKRHEKSHNSTTPYHEKGFSMNSTTSISSVSTLPPYPGPPRTRTYSQYPDEKPPFQYGGYPTQPPMQYYANQAGLADWQDGFEAEDDYDEGQNMYQNGYSASGRGTPIGAPNGRRGAGLSMPPERDLAPGYVNSRARTEDATTMAQWRQQQPARPLPTRTTSTSNVASMPSPDGSYSNGSNRPQMLRSQFSSSRLKSTYEEGGGERASAYNNRYNDRESVAVQQQQHRQSPNNPNPGGQPPLSRARSGSNPNYQPSQQSPLQKAPPVPIAPQWTGSSQSSNGGTGARIAAGPSREKLVTRNQSSLGTRRPVSGGSSDTGESSESPESGPIQTIRGTRSQVFNGAPNGVYEPAGQTYEPPVKIKVYWNEDLFMIVVPRATSFDGLVDRVQKKIRLCGGNGDLPLRFKYDDEDGDRISLSTDEELQMAFDMTLSRNSGQGQLTLRVA